jgi:5-formyltetrahydrofolate cyclo-ligase
MRELMEKNEIREEKERLRKIIFERRKTLRAEWAERADETVAERILRLLPAETKTVCAYVSVRGETGTGPLLSALVSRGIRIALPTVIPGRERRMRFFCLPEGKALTEALSELVISRFGIPEPPLSFEELPDPQCPMIVPGVAFSDQGARIGYGAGYYDRFFAGEPDHLRIACAYSWQVFPEKEHPVFSADPMDVRMDGIVTEAGVLRFRV